MQKTRHPIQKTSVKAFKAMKIEGLDITIQAKIMRAMYLLKDHKGIKTQISAKMRLPEEQVHKRLSELERKGIIAKTGRLFRSMRTGKLQNEWKLLGTPDIKK